MGLLFEFEDTVKMEVDRVAGTKNDKCTVFASSIEAAVKGLCWLTQETAAQMGVSAQEVVCRMAVALFGSDKKGKGNG